MRVDRLLGVAFEDDAPKGCTEAGRGTPDPVDSWQACEKIATASATHSRWWSIKVLRTSFSIMAQASRGEVPVLISLLKFLVNFKTTSVLGVVMVAKQRVL